MKKEHTINIATIITCHNRKQMTMKALSCLYEAAETYRQESDSPLRLKLFLTDDGCSDGTAESIEQTFRNEDIVILKGNGQLYWAGGMRYAWKEALKEHSQWGYYLLLNDDTFLFKHALIELLETHHYSLKTYSKGGVYSGITCCTNQQKITYGGGYYSHPLIGKFVLIHPDGHPQTCKITNANILLVPKTVVDEIGIFDSCYRHRCADWAYGLQANKAGLPVLVTASVCGICEDDHYSDEEEQEYVKKMSIRQRITYFSSPLRSTKDILAFMARFQKVKYPIVYVARFINIFFPTLYYRFNEMRPGFKKATKK
jgi:GT2 family glycosyltransferase